MTTITPTSPAIPTTISNLSAATTPLGGSEVVPIVQGGVTKGVTASQLILPGQINTVAGTSPISVSTANNTATVSITSPLPLANGGTNATTASGARTNLGLGTAAVENLGGNIIDDGAGNLTIQSASITKAMLSSTTLSQISLGGFVNKFRNGTMDIWQRGTASITVTTSGAYTADGWIVLPTGASCTAQQTTNNKRTGTFTTYSLLITGAASVTDIILKQRIESLIAQQLEGQTVTVQAQVYNNTGSSITPTLTVNHANASDNWSASTTDVNAVSLQACPNATWTQVCYTFSASTSSGNGLEIIFDFGNNFSTNGKSVQVTELDIRATSGVTTGLNSSPPTPELRHVQSELALCQRYYFVLGAAQGASATTTSFQAGVLFPVPMRATPTASQSAVGSFIVYSGGSSTQSGTSISISNADLYGGRVIWGNLSGLTAGSPGSMSGNGANVGIGQFTAEL